MPAVSLYHRYQSTRFNLARHTQPNGTGSAVVIGEWGGWYKTKEDQAWQKALAEFLVKEGFTDQFCAYVRFICIWVCLDPRMPACALIRLSIDMIVYTQFSDRLVPQPRRKCAVINAYTCCCKPNCSITSAPVYSHPTPHHYYIYTYTHIHIYKKNTERGHGRAARGGLGDARQGTDRVLFLLGFWLCFRLALRCADSGLVPVGSFKYTAHTHRTGKAGTAEEGAAQPFAIRDQERATLHPLGEVLFSGGLRRAVAS